jgi:hypothetical protein
MRPLIFVLALLYQSPSLAGESGEGWQQLVSQMLTKEGVVIAIITGLAGLIPLVVQALSNRARRKSHGHRLASLAAELEFLEKWTALLKEYQPDRLTRQTESTGAAVVSDLESILGQFQSLRAVKETHKKKPIPEVPLLRRVFLLFLPVSFKGWIYHTLFYVLLFFCGALVLSELWNPAIEAGTGTFTDLLIGLVIIFGLPLTILSHRANHDRNLHVAQQAAAAEA